MGERNIADVLSALAMISFIGAALFLTLAMIFFVKFRIPSVIGDLSGRTARKSIELMQRNNERKGDKRYDISAVKKSRDKLTDIVSETDKHGAVVGKQQTETVMLQREKGLVEIETIILIHTEEVI